ncbi:hypothetical protein J2T16_003689 [Paenibacillus intestini]|nr:hypothetical protein [Paenibacillus intestini]
MKVRKNKSSQANGYSCTAFAMDNPPSVLRKVKK